MSRVMFIIIIYDRWVYSVKSFGIISFGIIPLKIFHFGVRRKNARKLFGKRYVLVMYEQA